MQFSADFVALGLHQADVHRAERELGLRMAAEERGSDDAGASSEPVAVAGRTAVTAARSDSPCGERGSGRGRRRSAERDHAHPGCRRCRWSVAP